MVRCLRVLFACILVLMIGVTVWASFDKNVLAGFATVWVEPWGVATLADANCGFLTFYAWVFYKEKKFLARAAWLVAILALGNIAMSSYMLWTLWKLPANAGAEDILLRRAA